jgi:hypothetical protein
MEAQEQHAHTGQGLTLQDIHVGRQLEPTSSKKYIENE